MNKNGYSSPGLFGSMNHYNNKGAREASSSRGLFGGWNHYSE